MGVLSYFTERKAHLKT